MKRVLLEHDDLVRGRVQMINWALLPQNKAFRAHFHEDMQEVFIIVAGTARMVIDDETDHLGPGDAVVVPPRSVHRMENVGRGALQYVALGISRGEGGRTVVV